MKSFMFACLQGIFCLLITFKNKIDALLFWSCNLANFLRNFKQNRDLFSEDFVLLA